MATTLRAELPRKAVHISMGGFALLLRWLTPWQAVLMGVAALGLNVFLLHRWTRGRLLRPEERASGFSRGIVAYPAILIVMFIVFQSRLELAAGVWALLAVGDGMATLTGLSVGGARLPWNPKKTWSGLAGFVAFGTVSSASMIRWTQLGRESTALWPDVDVTWVGNSFFNAGLLDDGGFVFLLCGCLAAATVAAFAESLETSFDDNLLAPLSGALSLAAATLVSPDQITSMAASLLSGLPFGLAVTTPFAVLAYYTRSVDRRGAVAGALVGTLIYLFTGLSGFLLLALLVTVGVAATRFGISGKTALGIAQERDGRRGTGSVVANTGVAVACGFLAVATPFPELFTVAMVAAFSTALFDTTASEVGKASGHRHYLVTTWRAVPAGTDGAVSLEGTSAGTIAAVSMAVFAMGLGVVTLAGAVAVVVGALAGSMIESLVGARMRAKRGSDNEVLNIMNTVVGAAVAVALFEAFS